jgi:hypothetical protein
MNNTRRLIITIVSIIALGALAWFGVMSFLRRDRSPFQDAPKLISGIRTYVSDHKSHGQPMPAKISLQDLVDGGYVSAADVRAFDGMEVTISLGPDQINSKQVLMRARLLDGSVTALMADGSVESVPK